MAHNFMKGGVDGVEIHALHEGYLLDSFAMSYFNKREDEYGGSLENRLRFAKEIREEIARTCGREFPVSMRFSLKSYIKGNRVGALAEEDFEELGRDIEEGLNIARLLESYGYDCLDVDAGTYDAWFWAHPPYFQKRGLYLPFAELVKKAVDIPVLCAGMMGDPDLALSALENGQLDIVALGRPLVVDPDIVNKIHDERIDEIRPCLYCHEGCLNHFTPRKANCAVNTRAGKEISKPKLEKTDHAKIVTVIGAGPAGMETARSMAERGHKVTVYEKSDHVGGLFCYAGVPEFKKEVRQLIKWWHHQLEMLGVEIHFNSPITADSPVLKESDIIVTATGSNDLIPPIKGVDLPNVITAKQALADPLPEDEIAIIGAGMVGCEMAVWFSKMGKKVTLVEMQDKIVPKGASAANTKMIERYIDHYAMDLHISTKLIEIKPDAIVVEAEGIQSEIPVKKVILSLGFTSEHALYDALKDQYPNVINIGDSNVVRDVLDASFDAYELCKAI
jgi:2-enoate reductase